MSVLYGVPPYILLVAAMIVAATIACCGQTFVHDKFRSADFVRYNEVAGFIIAVVGTLYAVVIGFITIVMWQHYQTAQERLSLETASVLDGWRDAVSLPQPQRRLVRADMLEYAKAMIGEEWPRMRGGDRSPKGDTIIMDTTTVVGQLDPKNLSELNAQAVEIR